MTRTDCDRQWQAEALEDGRLQPGDRASFERHAATCRACAAELEALRDLRRELAAFPDRLPTELEHRRARIALLNAAEERSFQSPRATRRLAWLFAVPALVCALLLLRVWRGHVAPPGFEVANVAHADWSAERDGGTSLVTLRDGVASFHVEHVAGSARFLVALPDGQIEVRGTRFVVDVQAGVTRSVSVSEGVVWLRLGTRLLVLKRGEAYRADEMAVAPQAAVPSARGVEVAPSAAAPSEPPVTSAPRALPLPPVATAPSAGVAASASSHVAEAASASQAKPAAVAAGASLSAPAPTAGERFGEAMSAFAAGDYGRADALFAAFAREFPSDSRLEDAAFLRADARARRGDAAGAAALARDYLKRYPSGLRRPDAERLVGNRGTTP